MCYVTPDGTVGQAKAGVWASGQSGLLWFFDRGNAEVLVKVLDGCEHTGYRWAFVAPVTTLEFNLEVTAPERQEVDAYANEQGTTASTRSDTRAFRCADESASGAGAGAAVPGTVPWVPWPPSVADAVTRPPSVADMAPGAGPSLAEPPDRRLHADGRGARVRRRLQGQHVLRDARRHGGLGEVRYLGLQPVGPAVVLRPGQRGSAGQGAGRLLQQRLPLGVRGAGHHAGVQPPW